MTDGKLTLKVRKWRKGDQEQGQRLNVNGYKMKWHNIGPGQAQLRLCVAMVQGHAYLCHAYVKDSDAKDKREAAKLMYRIDQIEQGHYQMRGKL